MASNLESYPNDVFKHCCMTLLQLVCTHFIEFINILEETGGSPVRERVVNL